VSYLVPSYNLWKLRDIIRTNQAGYGENQESNKNGKKNMTEIIIHIGTSFCKKRLKDNLKT
jgi:hypothetical protein